MKQLLNERLVIDFMKILKKYKVQAKSFILELKEFIMFERHDKIRNTILKLREAGFKIAVDGFSFDHNTLLKIEQLPIDYIKLDSNFIQNDSKEIMKHLTNLLITFAKEHNITIIAERIEDLETVEHFKEYNINLIQGYLISKPISADAFVTFIGDDTNVIKKLSGEEEEIEVIEEVQEEVETIVEETVEQPETVVEETVEQPEVVEEPQIEEVQEENNQNNE
jgi:EAL domain-containing protein (putative c-di-GMP-specific phosphodiesterase class I)